MLFCNHRGGLACWRRAAVLIGRITGLARSSVRLSVRLYGTDFKLENKKA